MEQVYKQEKLEKTSGSGVGKTRYHNSRFLIVTWKGKITNF